MNIRCKAAVIGAVLLGYGVLSAASTPSVKSQVLSGATRVDGNIGDWPTLTALTKEVTVAAANDGDRLCLAIATSDPKVKQRLLSAGLIVYLDPQGRKGETFGVRIPPIGGAMGRGRFGGGPAGPRGGDPTGPPPPPPAGDAPDRALTVTYVEVIGPVENERHIVDLVQPMGFEVASGDNGGTLLIEVAMPLRKAPDVPYAPKLAAGKSGSIVVGIGLVTPDVAPAGRTPFGGISGGRGGMSGGRGGMGGGRGGSYGGGGGGMRGGDVQGKAIKIWTTLSLATPQ